MKQPAIKIILSCISLLTLQFANAQETHLYPVEIGGKFGYFNEKGEEVIKPKFRAAKSFHEGLAAARLNGTYGYIDSMGEYVIQPEYDYGYPFNEGVAIVYKNGKSFYIDNKGNKLFDCSGYQRLGNFQEGIALVETRSKKQGVVDKVGKLLIDTAFGQIVSWFTGVYLVSDLMYDSMGEYIGPSTYGIISAEGHYIIPFGKYVDITSGDGEYFVARDSGTLLRAFGEAKVYKYDVFDRRGKLLFALDERDGISAYGSEIRCGLLAVKLWDAQTAANNQYKNNRDAFVNLKGEVVIDGTDYKYGGFFYNNRAFVMDSNEQTWLINKQGELLNQVAFDQAEGFYNNAAFVMQDRKWGVVDTNGDFIVKPSFHGIRYARFDPERVVYYQLVNSPEGSSSRYMGLCDFEGDIIMEPIMEDYSAIDAFKDGLLRCRIDGRWCYVNRDGNIIYWQDTSAKPRLNIDYMNASSYQISQFPDEGLQPVITDTGLYPKRKLSVKVRTDNVVTTDEGYKGYVCYVVNNSASSVSFRTSMGLLKMTMQALDVNDEWRDIEYFEGSFCGNAYFDEQLNAWDYWTFRVPRYVGSLNTKMRMKLQYLNNSLRSNELEYYTNPLVVYSNEFEGSVNPAQFWRREHSLFGQDEYLPLDNKNY